MDIVYVLLPLSVLLGGAGLLAYLWCSKSGQFSDPDGGALAPFDDGDTIEDS